MCRNTEMCRILPPPPVWDLRDYLDAGGAPKKKVSESPPPKKKNSVVAPPPPLLKSWIRSWDHGWGWDYVYVSVYYWSNCHRSKYVILSFSSLLSKQKRLNMFTL